MAPDFSFEDRYGNGVCGVDEAGRGPWAGPVTAAAVILARDCSALSRFLHRINDSKQLSRTSRETLYEAITHSCLWATASASVEEIDQHNILRASLLAMRRAVEQLGTSARAALIDGIHAPKDFPTHITHVLCIPQGDARCLSIAAASILAKVTRDRLMREIATAYPEYGFERHAGYGTRQHREALERFGPTPWHRRSFAPVKRYLAQFSSESV